jgi:hypothetical protein
VRALPCGGATAAGVDIVEACLYNALVVSPKELTAFRMSPELMQAMRALKEKDGIPVAVQVDRAVRAYLKSKGIATESDRKRAVTRKRS